MSFPRATEMFQFTRFASHTYVFSMRYPEGWVSPFRNLRIKAYLPAPRSISQAITSFVAYHCQGIHHMLLVTWPYNFDISFETPALSTRTVLTGLSPVALCRNLSFRSYYIWISNQIEYSCDAIKKLLLAARSVLNLYECTVSANNADSTLWIFKEQPRWLIDINQHQNTL